MATCYTTESISGYNATPPVDDGTVSEANKIKWSTIKTKLPDPLKTAIENIDSKLTTHFNIGPTALTTSTTLDSTHHNKVLQVSGSGVTLTLSDAATLTSGFGCEIVSTDATNSVTLARTTGGDTINETAANVTILPLQHLKITVNAAANGFLVSTQGRHSKADKTAEAVTHTGLVTMSGKSIIDANASIAAHATTMDPWSLGNYVTLTGSAVTFTAMANAPQAGAEVELYMNAAHVWTDGAVFEVDGNANWTAEAGDRVLLRAKSTTVFTVHPRKVNGDAVGAPVLSTPTTQTIPAAAATLTFAHGLGVVPEWAIAVLVAGSSPEHGFTTGQQVMFTNQATPATSESSSLSWDATNVYVEVGGDIIISSRTTHVPVAVTRNDTTKWSVLVKAWG